MEFLLLLEAKLEKSISNRFYLDYNATSPLAKSVSDFLAKGEFSFGNPSSLHAEGKKSKFQINQTSEFLFNTFGLSKNEFDLLYHSGATEAVNTFFKGNAFLHFKKGEKAAFYFSEIDHACAVSLAEDLKSLGHEVYFFKPDSNSELEVESVINFINQSNVAFKYLNYTFMNNETGVIWPLESALKIKESTRCVIHVDAVQTVAKMEKWNELSSLLDVYTYSAHKFGAIKGVGFSFIKKGTPYYALLSGGSQQSSMRSGTENVLGIETVKVALEEILREQNPRELERSKKALYQGLKEINSQIIFIADAAKNKNLNTLFFIIPNQSGQTLQMKFDMNGLAVSTGSACSSGIIKENRIVRALGFSKEEALSCIRLSLPFNFKESDVANVIQKLEKILK